MVYVDQKDQGIVTDDKTLYQAWMDRKQLRMKHWQLGQEIAALDSFIDTYVYRVNPTWRSELGQIGVTMQNCSFTSTSAGDGNG